MGKTKTSMIDELNDICGMVVNIMPKHGIDRSFKVKALCCLDALIQRLWKQPKIICLCGSTRFIDAYNEWRKRLTIEGCIVLSIEIVTTQTKDEDPQHCDPGLKARLDELHLRKIDLADEVMVLNVGGYVGKSTIAEIKYAEKCGKPIVYLESIGEKEEHNGGH